MVRCSFTILRLRIVIEMEKLAPNHDTLKNDVPDGMKAIVTKMDSYLKQLLIWIRILVVRIISIILVDIMVYNFFAPSEKEVP